MKSTTAAIILLFLAAPALAATLGTPTLSPQSATDRFFDTDSLLTTGGIKYATRPDLSFEPEWGVGYRVSGRDLPGGVEESVRRVHAQAGWRVSLAETLYLSAAAKVPLLTVEKAEMNTGQEVASRQGYDFTRSFRKGPRWTGELGIHLTPWSDLAVYYDQSPVSGWLSGAPFREERLGTRIIFRFQ